MGEMNAVIDEAADKAGRGPQAVRRMLNIFGGHEYLQGGSAVMAERLAALTLEHGTSTFILGSDDPDELRRFAAEVDPRRPRPRRRASAVRSRRLRWLRRDEVPSRNQRNPTAHPSPPPPTTTAPACRRRCRGTRPPARRTPARTTQSYPQAAVPQHLVDIHDHLRAELAQVRDIVDQVRRGQLTVGAARSEINTMTMRQNNWTLGAYCESYCRIVTGHHTLEDRSVFTHLRRRDPDLGAVLDRLSEEHVVIHDVLEQVDDALVGLVGAPSYGADATAALDELQRALDLLTDTLLSHLAYEERELIPPLARYGFG